MKFLIAGLGSIGRRHLRNLLALGETDILLYRTNQSTLPDDELSSFPVFTSLDKALQEEPDAVIVSNPTSLHLDVAIPAARAGCHLFLEKPISHNLDGVDSLQTVVAIAGVRVVVGYQFRFHPGLNIIRQHLLSGEFGAPVSVRAHWGEYLPDWHSWEDYRNGYAAREDLGGGVIRTLCHPMDYLRWLIGEINTVWAITGKLGGLGIEVEDTAEIGLQFTNGAIGSVHVNYIQRPTVHRLEIITTQGTLKWDNADGSGWVYKVGEGVKWQNFPIPLGFERNDMFKAELNHFLNVVKGKAVSVCTLEDGIQAMKLISAAYEAANQKSAVYITS